MVLAQGSAADVQCSTGQGLGFIEAVEELANHLGMPVPREVSTRTQEKAKQQPLTERMARAARAT